MSWLELSQLTCNQRNDPKIPFFKEEDEVYLVVAGKSSQGKKYTAIVPDHGHWDLDPDNPAKRTITPKASLWRDELANFEMMDLTVFVLENDDNIPRDMQELAADVAERTNPGGQTIGMFGDVEKVFRSNIVLPSRFKLPNGKVSGDYNTFNSDDCLGVFAIRIFRKDDDYVESKFQARWRCEYRGIAFVELPGDPHPWPPSYRFHLTGDGADYDALFRVTGSVLD